MKGLLRAGLMGALLALALGLGGCCCGDAAEMFKGGLELAEGMQNAPGAEQLRGAGCSEAMVMTPEAIRRFAVAMGADEEDLDELDEWKEELVMCTREDSLSALDCPKVARVYAEANDAASERFGVIVRVNGQEDPVCQGLYNAEGDHLGELTEESLKLTSPQ